MKKAEISKPDEMRAEYDLSSGKRNPYADRFAAGSNIVMIRPDIFAAFPSEEAVNEALKSLMGDGITMAAATLAEQKKAV